jgi:hypothetical protein
LPKRILIRGVPGKLGAPLGMLAHNLEFKLLDAAGSDKVLEFSLRSLSWFDDVELEYPYCSDEEAEEPSGTTPDFSNDEDSLLLEIWTIVCNWSMNCILYLISCYVLLFLFD